MPRPLFDHFRFVAPIYDHVFDGRTPNHRVAGPLALPVDGWLLDAGGGTGRVSHTVQDQVGGIVVTDVSFGMLQQARQKAGVRPTLGQAEGLPFANGQFARILIVDAFHHFFHHEAAAQDLWRVLAPGGRLLIVEPNIACWPVKIIALLETLALMRSRFFTAEAMAAMFSDLPGAQVTVDVSSEPNSIRLMVEKAGD